MSPQWQLAETDNLKQRIKTLMISPVTIPNCKVAEAEYYLLSIFEELVGVRIESQLDKIAAETELKNLNIGRYAWSSLAELWMMTMQYKVDDCEKALDQITPL